MCCDMGEWVDDTDICPDHKGMCRWCCAQVKSLIAATDPDLYETLGPLCTCAEDINGPRTGYDDMMENGATPLFLNFGRHKWRVG